MHTGMERQAPSGTASTRLECYAMNVCRIFGHKAREVKRITWKPQDDGTEGTATMRCERCGKVWRRFLVASSA